MKAIFSSIVFVFMSVLSCSGQWTQVFTDLKGGLRMCSMNDMLFYSSTAAIYKSTDGGISWNKAINGMYIGYDSLLAYQVHCLYSNNNRLFGSTYAGMYISDDSAKTWTLSDFELTSSISSITGDNNAVYVTTCGDGVLKSIDNGNTWFHIYNGIDLSGYCNCITISGNTIYVGTFSSGVLKSTDGGASWQNIADGLNYLNVNCIYALNGYIYASTRIYDPDMEFGIFRLKEGDTTFVNITGDVYYDVRSFSSLGNRLFIGTYGSGVYYSDDLGDNWVYWGQGCSGTGTEDTYVYNNELYSVTCCGWGLWKNSIMLNTDEPVQNRTSLFPNPTGDYLYVSDPCLAQYKEGLIDIYNSEGKKIKSFVPDGENKISVSGLESGIYFVKIIHESYTSTSKFIKL